MTASIQSRPGAILDQLRQATSREHRLLEDKIALTRLPADRDYFVAVLKGFLGFHRVFEDSMSKRPAFAELIARRRRTPHLEADLRALGVDDAEIAATANCADAAHVAHEDPEVWGAFYVIEGSTLGGQVITRALEGTPWLPENGLRTFYPYGAETGRMWNVFRAELSAASTEQESGKVIAGAVATFSLLRHWLPARPN